MYRLQHNNVFIGIRRAFEIANTNDMMWMFEQSCAGICLADNTIGVEGGKALGDALKVPNGSLYVLDLSSM